jgi:hypothetical protein
MPPADVVEADAPKAIVNVVEVGVEATAVAVVKLAKFVESPIPYITIKSPVVKPWAVAVVIVAVVEPAFTADVMIAVGTVNALSLVKRNRIL